MQQLKVKVQNRAGIHCRPSGVILNEVNQSFAECKFTVTSPSGVQCDLTSILGLLSLALACGDEVTVAAEGPNEEEAVKAIAKLFSKVYDFPGA